MSQIAEITGLSFKPGLTQAEAGEILSVLGEARQVIKQATRDLTAWTAQLAAKRQRLVQLGGRSGLNSGLGDLGLGEDPTQAQEPPQTDYASGMLRGWGRLFTKNFAVYFSGPSQQWLASGRTEQDLLAYGAKPTVSEWQAFDQQATELGVDQGTLQSRLLAAKSDRGKSDLISKVRSELRQVDKATTRKVGDLNEKVLREEAKFIFGKKTGDKLAAQAYQIGKDAIRYGSFVLDAAGFNPFMFTQIPQILTGAGAVTEAASGVRTAGIPTLDFMKSPLENVSGVVGSVSPLKFTTTKAVGTFSSTDGGLGQKLAAVGIELVHEVAEAASLAGLIAMAPGIVLDAAFLAVSAGLTAAQTGIDLATAYQAADQAKSAARAAKQAAQREAIQLDAETKQLEDQLASVKRSRSQVGKSDRAGGLGLLNALRGAWNQVGIFGQVAAVGGLVLVAVSGGDE